MGCESCVRLMGAWREERVGVGEEERSASAMASAQPIVDVEAYCDPKTRRLGRAGSKRRCRWRSARAGSVRH